MAASLVVQEFSGANGIIYYGSALLFVDTYDVEIVSDSIDITNISIFEGTSPLPAPVDSDGNTGDLNLAFPKNLPNTVKPYQKTAADNLERKQSQYMSARLNISSGLRQANIVCSGIAAAYNEELNENYFPRIGNYVYMQFSNSIDPDINVMNFPIILIKNVSFDFNIKNYLRWTLQGISVGEFSIFPGRSPN